MKHSNLKVGMKVKRVSNFNSDFYTSTDGNISTVSIVHSCNIFSTKEDGILVWDAEYFEPVIEEQTKEEVKMNKIDMNKKYRTRCGYPVRILCTDRKHDTYPVMALVLIENEVEVFEIYTEDGFNSVSKFDSEYNLVEVSPWEDFKKDDKVMVSVDGEHWAKRYFAYEKDAFAYTYGNGCTSWSSGDIVVSWKYCRKPTKEEMVE